jgi:hypothetical protein
VKYIIPVLLFFSCTKNTPENFLKSYIYSRYGKEVKKDYLIENATGKFLKEINELEEASLPVILDLKKYSLKEFKIHNKECLENTCTLSFTIGYKNKSDIVYSKKIIKLEKVSTSWKISRIHNVKTFLESTKTLK